MSCRVTLVTDTRRALEVSVEYPKVIDQLGEKLRRELDRMGTS
jgi:hypothetical protein